MKGDSLYLRHILDAIGKIEASTSSGRETFMARFQWQDSVIRQLEIIGEATKHLSDGLRAKHPDIPWRSIAGLRDKLIHHYFGVDLEAVWEITQKNTPELKQHVQTMLGEAGGAPP